MIDARRFPLPAVLAGLVLAAAPAAAQQVVRLPDRDRALGDGSKQLYTVGVAEGRDWEMFADVAQVAFDADENLYILDRGSSRIVVLGPDGRFVRQFGKKGGGPGELQSPMTLAVTADGLVVVSDIARRAFSVFTREGEFLRNVMFDDELGLPMREIHRHPERGVLALLNPMRLRSGGGPGESRPAGPSTAPIAWYPLAEGTPASKVFDAPTFQSQTRTRSAGAGNVVVMRGPPPVFTPTVRWGVLPSGGLAVAHSAPYSVDIVSPTGQVERRIERGVEPRRVTDADKERAKERRRAQMESGQGMVRVTVQDGRTSTGAGGPAPRSMIANALQNMEFAEAVPVIRNLTADPQGRLWIERAGRDPFAPGPIDLVAADGRYIGTLAGEPLPAAFSAGGRAAYIETDEEYGIQRVSVRELPASWR